MKFTAFDKRFVIFPLIILFIYIFVATAPLGQDIYFSPVWIRDITPDAAQAELEGIEEEKAGDNPQAQAALFNGKTPKVFMTDSRFGYFTADGEILRSSPVVMPVSASSAAWTEYRSDTVRTPVYRPDGSLITMIEEPGFVHIAEDRLYLFEPGGSAVKQYGTDGKPMWRYLHTAPITAFHTSKSGAVIGFSDGKLVCLDSTGRTIFDFYPGGSDYQVILGAGISADGRFAACVSGLQKQRAVLISIDGNKYKVVHHRYLTGNLRRQVFVDFDESGRNAVFECAEGIGFIDCERLVSDIIPQQGTVLASGQLPYNNVMAVISHQDRLSTLSLVEAPGYILGKTSFVSKSAFLTQEQQTLYLATDTKLARIDIK